MLLECVCTVNGEKPLEFLAVVPAGGLRTWPLPSQAWTRQVPPNSSGKYRQPGIAGPCRHPWWPLCTQSGRCCLEGRRQQHEAQSGFTSLLETHTPEPESLLWVTLGNCIYLSGLQMSHLKNGSDAHSSQSSIFEVWYKVHKALAQCSPHIRCLNCS